MVINSLKELDRLMILCRKRKVLSIKIDNIEFRLDDQVTEPSQNVTKHTPSVTFSGITEDTRIDTPDSLTEEQLMFYSAIQQGEANGQ